MSTRDYEAMFILEHAAATADFEATSGIVDQILEKHGAKIDQKEKWDERKLAYEIKGQRRGTYYLTYFTAEPSAIDNINEDVQLTEAILRHMVIALDVPIAQHIETTSTERELLAEDSRKNSLGGWGGRRDRRAGSARKSEGSGGDAEAAPSADAPKADAPKAEAVAETSTPDQTASE
ncbi:MAG: 30S ribosomal protein S6 [Planctomycetota bacterium]|nr:30S ribosomal protein S6 [Planctomycetota bacterium]